MNSSNEILKLITFIRVGAHYYYPEWGCYVEFFPIMDGKLLACLGIQPTTLDLSSQSGAIHHHHS